MPARQFRYAGIAYRQEQDREEHVSSLAFHPAFSPRRYRIRPKNHVLEHCSERDPGTPGEPYRQGNALASLHSQDLLHRGIFLGVARPGVVLVMDVSPGIERQKAE